MINLNLIKRKAISGHYYWVFPYVKSLLPELINYAAPKRKSVDGSWVYQLFPAKGEYRKKVEALSIFEELIVPEEELKEVRIDNLKKAIARLKIKARIEKNEEVIEMLEEAETLVDEGNFSAAELAIGEAEEELGEEMKTFEISFELRDEFSTG